MQDIGKYNILIAAGGTGGHIFPAEALAEMLTERGHRVFFATDVRGLKFAENFPAIEVKCIAGATVFSKSPWSLFKALFKISHGIWQSLGYIRKRQINIVVGFGGYPSFAPLFAGKLLAKPSILHEQNAVLGRANKWLAKFAKQVALSFPNTKFTDDIKYKTTFIGNPLRGMVRQLKATPYLAYEPNTDNKPEQKFNLVVFGGSQGASVFSDILPAAMKLLPADVRAEINLVQQVRQIEVADVKARYKQLNVQAEVAPFFNDMPQIIANSHLVIGRAGATTVAELCYIGRPSLLVPLPGALDADQANNAQNIVDVKGGWLCPQPAFTADYLATALLNWIRSPDILAQAAKNAKKLGQPDAALNLAKLVEKYSVDKRQSR
ncbi:MAG: undecaprenyldiphospho-muramoylpentapeptide beta-N-acetylglucosaminyltransferase [Rhizobiales bacterium]|nr:undecaprenyldiphospho-muramoylpentapeptide beta-N-acetylglucosaminyltransferase [Hyphomicrobiales bacterium]NRB13995.1 undecaprenyldiphospho-muramoylpentapeptide beta-N-acetylglucosaminyltransferase [Hyphomicrobiales bacterium]